MKYLGTYQSNLSVWHLQELMKLLETAIEQGEYSAGRAFDQAALDKLRQDGQAFGELPTASAGQRVTDDSLNRPFDLLRARFEALLREAAEFDDRAALLLAILEKDSGLVDQLLFAASLEYWASTQPNLSASQDVKWDFGMGHGPIAADIPATDPLNMVAYPCRPPVVTALTDRVRTGLATPAEVRVTPVKYMKWTFDTPGEVEELYGADWTKLTLLEAKPRVAYAGVPTVAPTNPFVITGRSILDGTPVYVRTQFTPRRNQVVCRVTNNTTFALSPGAYAVSPDDVVVMAGGDLYELVTDYTITPEGKFTPLTLPEDRDITIWFLEFFPSYQCSINQRDWSPVLMLDPTRPYPDTETQFWPLTFGLTDGARTALPVTDEIGNPTGLFIQLGDTHPDKEWLLTIANPGNPNMVGVTPRLEIEFARPTYLNALQVSFFTTFPVVLKQIEVEGLTADTRHSVYAGSAVLNRTTVLRFPRDLVRRVYLTFYQENYALKEYELESADALRREVMNGLQSALPYTVRRAPAQTPIKKRGASYEFGLEYLEGQDWTPASGVFVLGPHRFTGCPEVIRLDAEVTGAVDCYLCYCAYDAADQLVDENVAAGADLNGTTGPDPFVPGTAVVFPFGEHLTDDRRLAVHHTDVYLKWVPRTADALIERFLIQVTNRV